MTTNRIALVLAATMSAVAFSVAPVAIAGPDTTTTVITEDDPRWDCRTMGNRICGADNAQDVPAGDYR